MLKLLTLIVFTTLASCAVTKKTATNQQADTSTAMTSEIKASAFAQFFINDLNKELESQTQSLENYKPSPELIDKYSIQLFNNEYFVLGFITTNEQFEQATLNQLHITTGKAMGNKMTIRIPIKSFRQFLSLKGIEFFEMNPKSVLK